MSEWTLNVKCFECQEKHYINVIKYERLQKNVFLLKSAMWPEFDSSSARPSPCPTCLSCSVWASAFLPEHTALPRTGVWSGTNCEQKQHQVCVNNSLMHSMWLDCVTDSTCHCREAIVQMSSVEPSSALHWQPASWPPTGFPSAPVNAQIQTIQLKRERLLRHEKSRQVIYQVQTR